MVKISPSLLAADFTNLSAELEKLSVANADLIHLDIMDGHYVPNLTYGIPIIEQLRKVTPIPFDVHLMVKNPADYIDALSRIKDIAYISYHPETEYHNHRLIHKIKSFNIKAGWAINPAISADIIKPVISDLDFVLLMSVNPGFGGQSFISSVFDKITNVKNIAQSQSQIIEVQVDGGVTSENAPLLIRAGADILVAGSFVFKSSDYAQAIQSLRNTV